MKGYRPNEYLEKIIMLTNQYFNMKKMICSAVLLLSVFFASAQVDSLAEYTGKYKFPEGGPVTQVTVSVDNSGLHASSDAGESQLTPTGNKDEFAITAFGGIAIFKRNAEKVITGVTIQVSEMIMEGTKQPNGLTDLVSAPVCFAIVPAKK